MNYGPPKDIEFYDFSGGVNVADSEYQLGPNELSAASNVLPNYRGALTVRKGYAAYNATQIVAGRVFGMAKFYREGATDVLIASCAGKLYSAPTSGASTDVGLAGTYTINSNYTDFAQYRNRMYATCPNDWTTPKMSVIADNPDATGVLLAWPWGVTTPTNAPTCAVSNAVGEVDDEVYYKYSYLYGEDGAFGESNPSPASAEYEADEEQVAVTVFGAGKDFLTWEDAEKAGIGSVYIYRTKEDGSVYYYCGEMTAGTEVFVDNVDDDDLDDLTSPESDNYAPDNAKYLCVHEERMFIGGLHDGTDEYPKRVRWSAAGYPDIFPNLNYVDAPAEHGDIMGLKVLNGILYVFFESAIGALRVYGEADAEFRIVSNDIGVLAPRSIVIGNDGGIPCAFFLGRDYSVYRFDGTVAVPISRVVDKYLTGDVGLYTATFAKASEAAAAFDGTDYILDPQYGSTGSGPQPRYVLRYNTRARRPGVDGQSYGSWWIVSDTSSGTSNRVYCRLDGGSDGGEVVFGGDISGFLFVVDSGYADYTHLTGSALVAQDIPFSFATGRMNLGIAGHVKSPRRLLLDKESADDVTLKFYADASTTPSTTDTSAADTVRTRHNIARIPCRQMKFELSGTSTAADSLPVFYGFVNRFNILRED